MKRALIAGLALAALAAPGFAEEDYHPTWNLVIQDEVATLNYAIAESDDGGPTLLCLLRRGHNTTPGRLTAYYFPENRLRGRTATLRLTSGAVTTNVPARVETNEESGGSEMEGSLPITAPVITEFARTGRITFAAGGETDSPPVAPRAKIAQLLAACRR